MASCSACNLFSIDLERPSGSCILFIKTDSIITPLLNKLSAIFFLISDSISDLFPECISFAKYCEQTSADADLKTLAIIPS